MSQDLRAIQNRFVRALKLYQERNRFSNEALADIIGIHRHTVANWVKGRTKPALEQMEAVVKHLNLDADLIFLSKRDPRHPFVEDDWLLFGRPCCEFEEAVQSGNMTKANKLLQDVSLDLYRYFAVNQLPVVLKLMLVDMNEQLYIDFPWDHVNFELGPHRLYIMGGPNDCLWLKLMRLMKDNNVPTGRVLMEGALTKGLLSAMLEMLVHKDEQYADMYEALIKQKIVFEQVAEGHSTM